MDVLDLAGLGAGELTDIRQQVEPLRTLGDLLDWSRHLTPPVPSPMVITQDEYAHDVLVPYIRGRWLDFDTT
jgi:hypothetical protein